MRSFSDAFLRAVQSEIDNVDALRLSQISDLKAFAAGLSQRLWLIVLHSRNFDHVSDPFALIREVQQSFIDAGHPRPAIVIAYSDINAVTLNRDAAMKLLRDHDKLQNFSGLLPMSQPMEVWLDILRLQLNHGTYFPVELLTDLLSKLPMFTEMQSASAITVTPLEMLHDFGPLTRRETQVLSMVADGLQNKQIADELSLSEHTVKLHMHNVIAKLKVRNRTEAAMRYTEMRDRVSSEA
ncbi:helix-turn-helix domain-containing protein [Celeribacter neptunius]|nr:response regulator transcription factor [Celeribacter neptunius]